MYGWRGWESGSWDTWGNLNLVWTTITNARGFGQHPCCSSKVGRGEERQKKEEHTWAKSPVSFEAC